METQADYEAVAGSESQPATEYFSAEMPPVRLPIGYQLGLALVGLAMVLLPLVYLGFIAIVGWATWLWATHAASWFFPVLGGTRRIFWALGVLYIIPLFVGFVLLCFMVKRLFSRWRVADFSVPISHSEHPELFRFLGQLCQRMGAPIPSRVNVTLGIGASARFRAGFTTFFGNDIALTFGLPLVASLSCREFAAVLAHELGHFTQRSAMRFNFLIRIVHGWLYRAVYEHDELDLSLEEATNENFLSLIFCTFSRMAVAFTRGLMWLLLMLSYALTSFLSRQMEVHADACATAVAGTEGFVTMFNKLVLLSACSEQSRHEARHRVTPKFPDDLSAYLALLASQCSGQMQGKVQQAVAQHKTGWFDSHPADPERLQRARQANQPGIIQDHRPAALLFNNFHALSRSLTLSCYQNMGFRGRPISPDQIFSVVTPPAEKVPDTSAEEDRLPSYFGGLGSFLRPVLLSLEGGPSSGLTLPKPEQVQEAKIALQHESLPSLCASSERLDAQRLQALQADALCQAGVTVDSDDFSLLGCDDTQLPALLQSIQTQAEQLGRKLEPFERAARLRLTTALSLLRTPAFAARIPDIEALQDEVLNLLHACGKISALFPMLLELRQEDAILQALLGARGQAPFESLHSALAESTQRANHLLASIQSTLGSAAYPFAHPKGHISILDYARAKQFDADPARMTQLEVQSHLQMLLALYYQVLGRLVAIAMQVEEKLDG